MTQRKFLTVLFLAFLTIGMEFPALAQKVTITTEKVPGTVTSPRAVVITREVVPAQTPSPAQGTVTRIYDYYPDSKVYYRSSDRTWFWQENGAWRKGSELPVVYAPTPRKTSFLIDSDTPYEYHERLIRPGTVAKEVQVVAPPVPEYRYTYYPDSEVYFDNDANQYLWTENGAWRVSESLPVTVKIDTSTGKPIEMSTDVRLRPTP